MLERLLIAAALLTLLLVAIQAGRLWYAWRNDRIERRLRERADAEYALEAGQPRIVYFTTRTCVICKVQQEPALSDLRTRRGDVVIERHDAVADRGLADEYGVLSVPTTAVYDASGRLVQVNRGFAPASLLLAQLGGASSVLGDSAGLPSEPVR